ncbi:MAG: hypothetical protein AAGL10_12945 [Pseudomonadota bacterium]
MVTAQGMGLKTPISFSACALSAVVLSGCAGDPDRYPSLAVRDIERTAGQFATGGSDTAPPQITAVADTADIQSIMERARTSFMKFEANAVPARREIKAARGQASDSSDYTNALLTLADLSSLRSETALALGEMDLLAAKAKTEFAPTQTLEDAQAQIVSLVEQQDIILAQLWGELGS